MLSLLDMLLITSVVCVNALPPHPRHFRDGSSVHYPFFTREDWGAEPAKGVTSLGTPVPYVIIHHTYSPAHCTTTQQCKTAMQSMQNTHQNTNGWNDIGYNFAVGGDGSVYEGRGWRAVGAHAAGYNSVSIGIVLIGDWVGQVPPPYMLNLAKEVISSGVEAGYISKNYKLIGHRQASLTECPGEAFFNEIRTWPHFWEGPV